MIKRPIFGRGSAGLLAVGTLAYAAVLFLATHTPDVQVPSLGPAGTPSDKVIHLVGYGALAFLTLLTVKAWRPKASALLPVILCLSAVAAIDELTQPLTSRDAEWLDWVADLFGIIIGASLATALAGRTSQRDETVSPPR